jgi:hypothetical protein
MGVLSFADVEESIRRRQNPQPLDLSGQPEEEVDNSLLQIKSNAQALEDSDARGSVFGAVQENPDTYASDKKIADRMSLPVEAVRLDKENIEGQLKFDDVMETISKSPSLKKYMTDPENASVSHDDTEALSTLEKIVASPVRGLDQVQGMLYGSVEWAGEAVGAKGLTRIGRKGRELNKYEAEAHGPKDKFEDIETFGDFFSWSAQTLGEVAPMMATPIAGASTFTRLAALIPPNPYTPVILATAATLGAFVGSFPMLLGEAQGALKDKDPDAVATGEVFTAGVINSTLDSILPAKIGTRIAKSFGVKPGSVAADIVTQKTLGAIVNKIGGQSLRNATLEGFTEVAQEAITEVFASEGAGQEIDVAGLTDTIVESFASGFIVGGGMTMATESFVEMRGRSEAGAKKLGDMSDASQNSKTRERSPEHFKKNVKQLADDYDSKTVYIEPDGMEALFQSTAEDGQTEISEETLNNPTVKKILEDIEDAKRDGRNIEIPLEEYLTDIPDLDIREKIAEHSKVHHELMTPNEAKNTNLEEEAKKSDEKQTIAQAEEAFVNAEITQNAIDLGKPRSEAKAEADRLTLMYKVQADAEGISIKDAYQGYDLNIENQMPGQDMTGEMLNQQAAEFGVTPEVLAQELEEAGGDITQTPRFKEWFGESKVIGTDGKPVVVYHGTEANITEFSNQTPGKRGFYFTTDLDKAETHRGKNNDWEAGSIMPVYLAINNPIVISDFTTWEKLKAQFTGEKLRASSEDGSLTTFLSDEQVDSYIAQGYDGIINEKGGEIIAFAPEQIKSVYNQGTFSSETGEILKQSTPLSAQPIDDIMTTTVQQSSEALPSTGLLAGRMIKSMDQSIQELYQEEVNKLSDKLVEQITGLVRVDSTNSPSRFDGHIGASQQIRYKVETMKDENGKPVLTPEYAEKIKMAAAIKGYIQDQDAVVNSFFSSITDESQADVYSIDIGRVLTHEEMVAVDQKIAEVSKKLGINPDHIATPTTAEGVDLLNVSGPWADVEATQLHLKEIYVSVSEVLNAKGGTFFKNVLRDTGYIGGFDGYKSGQEVYQKIRDSASGGNSGGGRSEEQWWGHADRVEAKRAEIRGFTEKFIKDNPLPTKTIRQIGEESDALAKKEKRVISAKDFSEKAELSIADQMFTEALSILRGGDKDARGWYTARFQQALDDMGQKHPELLTSQNARDLYTTFVAITSDGARVSINMKFANAVYESYKKTGKVNEHIPSGERSASYKTNLNFLQRQIDEKGLEGAMEYLGGHELVSKLENDLGVKSTGFSKTAHLPRSTIFGPKLGLFWANLMGQPDYLTMDRWWSRTFNRYRGKMTADPSTAQIDNFKKLLGRPTARVSTVLKEAKRITKIYSARKFKNGTPIEKAANIIHKRMTGLIDAPAGVRDRAFQFAVTDRVVKELKTEVKDEDGNVTREAYPDMTISDLQAVLWYGEKRRMREMGSKSPINEVDFADVAEQVIKENNKANVLLQSGDGSMRGYYREKSRTIGFTKNADLTTFIHESSHHFLNFLYQLAPSSPRVTKELSILDKWYADNGAVTHEEKHEMFASGQEQYLMEGNAPTKELRPMFSRFKSWIIAVYKRMESSPFGSNNMERVQLSDEVRGVFDRMYASQEAINQSRAEMGYDNMPIAEMGLSQEDFDKHQALRDEAKAEADEQLTKEMIDDLKRQKAKWWGAEMRELITEIGNDLSKTKEYATRDWLTGKNIPDGGEPVKLNKAYVDEFYDKEAKAKLRVMTSEGGMNPDQLAEYFEYSSGDEMIQALLGTMNNAERKAYIKDTAEQTMIGRHGDILRDFGKKEFKANETVHNEKQAELLALELRMLNGKVGKDHANKGTPKDVRGIYRAAAEEAVSEMQIGELKPDIYLSNERKHGRDAFKLATEGKWVEARDAKHKQLRQFYMHKEASKAKKKADKMATRLRQWQRKKFEPKKVNPDFIKQVKGLLQGIHFGKKIGEKRLARISSETLEAWAEQQEKKYGASFHISAELDNAINKANYAEMTFEELMGLHDTVKSILAQGKKFSDIEKAIWNKNMEEGEASIADNATKVVVTPKERTWLDNVKGWGRFVMAEHRTAESVALEVDGNKTYGGWVHKNVYLRLKHGDDRYIDRSQKAGAELNDIFKAYTRKEKLKFFNKTYIPELGESLSLSARLAFALNIGNAGNVDAMQNEYSDEQIDGVLDTLSDRDWDVVEAIWKNIDQYWEEISALEERTTGVKPAKVEAVPFTTSSGREISGGYYPLVADPLRSIQGKKDFEVSQTLDGFMNKGRAKASTKHGSTIERVGFGQNRFVWLDLGVVFNHVDGVLKDIEMREAVAETNRIITNSKFRDSITTAKGQEFHAVFEEWIKSVAGSHDQPMTKWDEFTVWARTGVSLAEMGFSPRTILQQPFGITQTASLDRRSLHIKRCRSVFKE